MKTFHVETERLILRELRREDAPGLFELDSAPEVHRYLGNQPLHDIDQCYPVIESIQGQYRDHGIGRWAVIRKSDRRFLGWAGLKWITEPMNGWLHYYDLGYRLIPSAWGQGYATEAALHALQYGFETLGAEAIYAICETGNVASRQVLTKCGLQQTEVFEEDGIPHYWFEIYAQKGS